MQIFVCEYRKRRCRKPKAGNVTEVLYDLLVIGGGVNGVGIARDAVGRGLSVLLCEKNDLAGATSSASTKLIHGGLRYLEYYEFRLVREALMEREVLLRSAPHIIRPLRFVLPHDRSMRPAWMVRIGLFLYDHLGGRKILPASHGLKLRGGAIGRVLRPELTRGFEYSDCWVDDARLVALAALDARERGAEILTRTACVVAKREGDRWTATLRADDGTERQVAARGLVNAGGPWVRHVLNDTVGLPGASKVRLVKGSHIVVPRLYDGPEAFILQNADRRIVFVIPYEGKFSLIGTTDLDYQGDPTGASITPEETAYLCEAVGRCFTAGPTPDDVVWSYAGVRPLYDDGSSSASEATRDYVLELDAPAGQAPALSVFGGKITTFRRLSEHALEKLAPVMAITGKPWTATAALPGGDIPDADFESFLARLRAARPWLPEALARRLARAYGTRVDRLLGTSQSLEDLGRDFGAGLTEAELEYLADQEWARTADDVLWRRSKLGLHIPAAAHGAIDDWLRARNSQPRERAAS
jgi:glycerol-3-phosphate dehydrogenase